MENGREKYYRRDRGRDLRRRVPGRERRVFQVTDIQSVHREIVRRHVLGQKNVHIAKALGVSPVTVGYTLNSPIVQEEIDRQNGARDAETFDLKKEIQALLPEATARLKELVTTGKIKGKEATPSLIAKSANDLIDREIGRPTQTVRGEHAHAIFTSKDIEEIKARVDKRRLEKPVEGTAVNAAAGA